MSEFLRAENVGKIFRKGPARIEVLRGLDLVVDSGETVSISGASGVGKSTLLHLLGALDRPTTGHIRFRGKDFFDQPEKGRAEFRNRSVGFVFQFHYLLPEFTALENVMMPLLIQRTPMATARERAQALLDSVGLADRIPHRPAELSGGEQQRVAIARALVTNPDLILADEPTGNLDVDTARSVTELLFDVVAKNQKSMIVATHNPVLAARANRNLRLQNGQLETESPTS